MRLNVITAFEQSLGDGEGQGSLTCCSPWGCKASDTTLRLNNIFCLLIVDALEKEMATHSSILAWRIPGATEPGGLPSLGLHRVGHD